MSENQFQPFYFTGLAHINFENYDLQKIVLLFYLFVHCKKGDYYLTIAKSQSDLGIKKGALKTIIESLRDEGLIAYETRGMANANHFTVNYKMMASKPFLTRLFKTAESVSLYTPFFQQAAKEATNQTLRTRGKSTIRKDIEPAIDQVLKSWKQYYVEARQAAQKESGKQSFQGFNDKAVTLPINRYHRAHISRLMTDFDYSADSLNGSFRAFIFNHYGSSESERLRIDNPISFFLRWDGDSQEFPTVTKWLNYYQQRYAARQN